MVGSGIDGEDVVQEALLKAIEAFPGATTIGNVEAWLFRIAHNTALDFLRSRARQQKFVGGEDVAMIADPVDEIHRASGSRSRPAHIHAPAGRATQQRHLEGCARLLAGRDRRHHRQAPFQR